MLCYIKFAYIFCDAHKYNFCSKFLYLYCCGLYTHVYVCISLSLYPKISLSVHVNIKSRMCYMTSRRASVQFLASPITNKNAGSWKGEKCHGNFSGIKGYSYRYGSVCNTCRHETRISPRGPYSSKGLFELNDVFFTP